MARCKPGQLAVVVNCDNTDKIGILCRVIQRAPADVEDFADGKVMWDVVSQTRPFAIFCNNCLHYHHDREAYIADRNLMPIDDEEEGTNNTEKLPEQLYETV